MKIRAATFLHAPTPMTQPAAPHENRTMPGRERPQDTYKAARRAHRKALRELQRAIDATTRAPAIPPTLRDALAREQEAFERLKAAESAAEDAAKRRRSRERG